MAQGTLKDASGLKRSVEKLVVDVVKYFSSVLLKTCRALQNIFPLLPETLFSSSWKAN